MLVLLSLGKSIRFLTLIQNDGKVSKNLFSNGVENGWFSPE
jgi:hypothetical protein